MKKQWGSRGFEVFSVTTEDSVPNARLKGLQAVLSYPLAIYISSGSYGTIGEAVPSNYVIGRDGRIRYAKAAAFDAETVNEVILPLLNEPAPQ